MGHDAPFIDNEFEIRWVILFLSNTIDSCNVLAGKCVPAHTDRLMAIQVVVGLAPKRLPTISWREVE